MTAPDRFDPSSSPLVQVAARLAAPAGHSVVVDVGVTHRGSTTETLTVTVLGLDPEWVPGPLSIGPLAPGESTVVRLTLVPSRGTLGAEYPFVVAVQAGRSTTPGALGTAESHLMVDALDRLTMSLEPQAVRAVFGKKITVQVGNPGSTPRDIELAASAAAGASISLDATHLHLQPGQSLTVPGRVKVTRPRVLGHANVHAFSITGRGRGAPHHVDGTVRSRPMLGGKLTGAISLLLIVAVWVAAAIVLIPRLSRSVSDNAQQQAFASAGPSSGAPSGSDSAAPGTEGDGGPGGEPGAEGEPGAGGDAPKLPKLAGTVAGPSPEGVTALLEPTTLAQAVASGAMAAPTMTGAAMAGQIRTAGTGPIGKLVSSASVSAILRDTTVRSTVSDSAGAFEFSDVRTPGLYLLTLTMAGFQTQRFVVDADQLAAGAPLDVTMVPGEGTLAGAVTGPDGAVGAATITITDGTVSLQTSSVSLAETGTVGDVGSWTVDGLSTPGTYLVTASSPGLGDASALVTLGAAGTDTVDLSLAAGQAQVTGVASGRDDLDQLGGLGGLTVTATGASAGTEVERTTTTVTTGPVGTFVLPDLPVPGEYTVTVSGTGYVPVTRTLSLAADSSAARLDFSMTRSTGSVVGTVSGISESGEAQGGLPGVGLSLVGQDEEFRTMSASDNPGVYRFAGVPPGTYVVSASQFGRRTSAATVTVTAAGTVTADLSLLAAADAELGATSRIRGRVVDARTQGALTCDRAAVTTVVCSLTAAVTPDSGPDAGRTLSTGAAPGEEYTVPSLLDSTTTGLVPGVYQVTLSAPGYESTSVPVQVAEGQVAPAPQVALQPLGVVTGAVGTRVGTPSAPSCVVVVPAGSAVPTGCALVDDGCEANGGRCTVTAADGTFRIAGLVHGGYRAVVIPQDTEYRSTQPLDIQLELGGDYRYEPVLDRLGRIAVTVLRPDQQTLALSPVTDAAIEIRPSAGGDPLGAQIGSAGPDNVRTYGRLTGTFTVTAAGVTATGEDTGLEGPITVADNQTAVSTVILTRTIGAVVGHLGVAVDGQMVDVAGAKVTVTGVVRFVGRTAVSEAVTVTTDAQGCYALLPDEWPMGGPPLTTDDCPSPVTDSAATGRLDLVALPLSLSVVDDRVPPRVLNHIASAVVIPRQGAAYQVPSQLLQANPSDATGSTVLTLNAPPNSGFSPSNTTAPSFTVLRKPVSAGDVTVAVGRITPEPGDLPDPAATVLTRTETLIWRDAAQGGDNRLLPGRYTLSVSRHGFTSATIDLWCGLGEPCVPAVFDNDGIRTADPAPPFVQLLLPRASFGIRPPVTLPQGVVIEGTTVDVTSQPIGSDATASVSDTGAVTLLDRTLVDPLLPGANLLRPGRYIMSVSLPGFEPRAGVALDCGADFVASCALAPGDGVAGNLITLRPLPTFAGTVSLAGTIPAVPGWDAFTPPSLSDIDVVVSPQVNPAAQITVEVEAGTGRLVWNDPVHPLQIASPATYQLQFSLPGYATTSSEPLTCSLNNCTLPPVTMNLLPTMKVTLQLTKPLPAGVTWDNANINFTARAPGSGVLEETVVAIDDDTAEVYVTDPGLPWPGIVQTGTYALDVQLDGYGTFSSGNFTCTTGLCARTIALSALPEFSGTLQLGAQPPSGVVQNLSGVTLSVADQRTPTRQVTLSLADTSGSSSALVWTESGQPVGRVAESTYVITATKAGYLAEPQTLTCSKADVNGCALGTLVLQLLPVGAGSITLDPAPPNGQTVNWAAAVISQTSAVPGTEQLKVTVVGDPTAPTGTARGLLQWADPTLTAPFQGLTRPGTYTFSITVPGYGPTTTAAVTCVAGGTCAPVAVPVRMAAFTGTVSLNPSGGTLTAVSVSVESGAVSGREPTVTVLADGTVNWVEPGQPANLISQGTYSLRFSLAGYTSVTRTLTCTSTPAGPPVSCDLGAVELGKFPVAGGTVTLPAGPAPTWSQARARVLSAPAGSAVTVTVVPDPVDPLLASLRFADGALTAGTVTAGSYEIELSIPGFETERQTFSCAVGGDCTVAFAPARLPAFSGTVRNDPAVTPVVATVLVQAPAGIQVSVSVAADGTLTWQQTGLPAGTVTPGSYVLTATAAGYLSPPPVSMNCTLAGCPAVELVLTRASALQIAVVDADSAEVVNGATVTLVGDGATSTTTLTAPPGSNSVSFPAKDPTENYTATVGAAGFDRISVTSASTAEVTCVNGSRTVTGLQVLAGGSTTCTVRLKKLGTITGTVGANFVATGGTVTSTLRQLGSIPVTVRRLNSDANGPTTPRTPAGPTFSAVSSATSPFSITGTAADPGLRPGWYEIRTSANGFDPFVGTVRINDAHQVEAVTGGLVTVTAGQVSILMTVKPVKVQVRLLVGGAAQLPGVTIRMTGEQPTPVTYTCTIAAGVCTSGGTGTIVGTVNATAKHVEFSNVVPGIYDVEVTSADNSYRPIRTGAEFLAGVDPAVISLSTDTTASTQTGKVVLASGGNAVGAEVSLRVNNNTGQVATNADGTAMTMAADASGNYTFTLVPQGTYQLVARVPGRVPFAQTVALDSSNAGKVPASVTIANTRATRSADLTVTTTARGAPALTGTSLTLTSAGAPAGLPADAVQSNLAINASGVATTSSIGTGNWTAAWVPGAASPFPFGAPLTSAAVAIPDQPHPAGTTPVAVPLQLKLAQVELAVQWPSQACAGVQSPGTGSTLLIDVVQGTTTKQVTATVTSAGGTSTAKAVVYLPPGSFTFAPAAAGVPADWTTPEPVPVVVDSALTTDAFVATSPIVLTPVRVPVTVSVSGSAASSGLTVQADDGDAVAVTGGTAALCAEPGSTVFTLASTTVGTTSTVAPKTVTVEDDGLTEVDFEAYLLSPIVKEAAVVGRTSDAATRTVALTISQGGTTIQESVDLTLPANGSSIAGPTLVVGPGVLSLTATPTGGAFGPGTETDVDPAALPADGQQDVVLPYARTMLTVTVTGGLPSGPISGATVAVTPDGGAATSPVAGSYLFRDLVPGTDYTVNAEATIDGSSWSGSAGPQQFATGPQTLPLALTPPAPAPTSSSAPPTG